ncbi:MAG: DUF2135 domain-containing protein [Thiobacillus sp.]|nr:DUF2135 domain-containing protein [Thiobacillus sp.]
MRTATILLSLLFSATASAADVEITAPIGGWRNSEGQNVRYSQPVNYPAVVVSVPEGQSRAGLIAGRIAQAKKPGRAPATLIVNGVALPQRIESDGSFSRPYSFGRGSNSVELRAPGGASRRVQFHESYGGRAQSRLRVVLAWDTDGTDLDLHVVTPDGGHAFYGNRVLDNGGALDVDVTTGYGPEIFSMPAPLPGAYLVYVNYYGRGDGEGEITVANVTVISQENTPGEKKQFFTVPLRNAGELILIGEFHYP